MTNLVEPEAVTRLREALKAVREPIGNMVDRHEVFKRRMAAQSEWQQACTPDAIEYLLAQAEDKPAK